MAANFNMFSQTGDLMKVNQNGRMTWTENGLEAFYWGVNYSVPHAHAFRQIARMGDDREKVIDMDTYHMARLGNNAFRIHVWDCEISDKTGNLLQNEHLRLLDYLIYRLQERGMYVFLTPIAYWGNGYPEPNQEVPGFSGTFSKGNAYHDPAAIEAQERYLIQFANHVNTYTGKAYKNDPMILGFEICNEPSHSRPAETTAFVKRMIAALRSTGCTKPVFYNVSQNVRLLDDYIQGGTDGVTFQWYPTGLVAGREVPGNYLPHVDNYDMPFKNEKSFLTQARLVYEFDAADVGRSYMFPPIALSFKEAGMQFVTMFSYDPITMASINTEYQTHFLNLAYSPQKAIGFKIAGELFRNPRYQRDRKNEKKPFEMDGVNISYRDDLAELATDELFYYTNNTSVKPANPSSLRSVAGYGSSAVVSYKGRGVYFLDKMSDGVWRLEVMPDAIWVRDPFSRATPKIENVVIKWNAYDMTVNLPDLQGSFTVTGVNAGNNYTTTASGGEFKISPGAYILSTGRVTERMKAARIGTIAVNEFVAPPETSMDFYLLHTPAEMVTEGQAIEINVEVISPPGPVRNLSVQLGPAMGRRGRLLIPMEQADTYRYTAVIPDSLVRAGTINYVIIMDDGSGKETVYPGEVEGPTNSWEYYNPESYAINVIPAGGEVVLFCAETSNQVVNYVEPGGLRSSLVPSNVRGGTRISFSAPATDNIQGRQSGSELLYCMQNYIGNVTKGISPRADDYTRLLVYGEAIDKPVVVAICLIDKDGNAYTAKTTLMPGQKHQSIDLKNFSQDRMFLLPRPYPRFLPFWYTGKSKLPFVLTDIERIQFMVPEEGNTHLSGFELTAITVR
jgi:hypothetical protein